MHSDRPSSSIDRRVLISGMALLPVLSGMPLAGIAQAQTTQGGSLASWNDGPAKQAILDFVKATTDRASPKFVPPEERIATFDQDGTLWVEHPIYSQVIYCLDRVPAVVEKNPKLKNVEPFKTVLSGNREAIAKLSLRDLEKILVATLTGMSVEEFNAEAKKWLTAAKDPRWKRPYTDLIYQPMLEVMQYLRGNGFKTYIVTGGGQDFVRVYSRACVRHTARAGGRHRGRHKVRLPQGRQAVPDQRAEVTPERRQGRQARRHSPDDRPAAIRGVRQFGWRPANA